MNQTTDVTWEDTERMIAHWGGQVSIRANGVAQNSFEYVREAMTNLEKWIAVGEAIAAKAKAPTA